MQRARLSRYGVLSVTGDDARDFLHAQLTSDIQGLAADRAALAGWCSAQGRLLATLLVIPAPQGFLLQLARDLAPGVAKRLGMFILRSKVKLADESDAWTLAEQGPCARCHRPCRRYGPRGRPLCDDCLAARSHRQADEGTRDG